MSGRITNSANLPTASGTPDSDAFQSMNLDNGALVPAHLNPVQVHQGGAFINGTADDKLVDVIFHKNPKVAQGAAPDLSPSSTQFARLQVPRNNVFPIPQGIHVLAARIATPSAADLIWTVAQGLPRDTTVAKVVDGLIVPDAVSRKLTIAGILQWTDGAEEPLDFKNFIVSNNRGGQTNVRLYSRADPKYNGNPTVTGQGSQYYLPQRSIWQGAPVGYVAYSVGVGFDGETTILCWN